MANLTFNFPEGKVYQFPVTKRPPEGSKAKGTILYQRRLLGAIEADVASIPRAVLEKLLFEAIEAKLQAKVKKLDQNKCTLEEAQAAMTEAFNDLVHGSAAKGKRTVSLTTKIRAEARKLLKEGLIQLNEQSDDPEEINSKALTETVAEYFKAYDEWVKPKCSPDRKEALDYQASIVASFLKAGEQRLKEQSKLGGMMAALQAKQASGSAQTQAQPKPTPTQAETARRKAKGQGQGRSA